MPLNIWCQNHIVTFLCFLSTQKKNFQLNFFLVKFFRRNMIFHKILVCLKFVVTKVPQQMYCKFFSQKFLVKVFFSQIFFSKNSSCQQICTHFLNLVFCVYLFVCLSVSAFANLPLPEVKQSSGQKS